MSVKDVEREFLNIESEYNEMNNTLNLLVVDLKNNKITLDEFNAFKDELKPIETNYERLSYMMFLLHQPNKKSKKAKEIKQNGMFYEYFEETGNDFNSTENENKNILKNVKARIKALKDKKDKEKKENETNNN